MHVYAPMIGFDPVAVHRSLGLFGSGSDQLSVNCKGLSCRLLSNASSNGLAIYSVERRYVKSISEIRNPTSVLVPLECEHPPCDLCLIGNLPSGVEMN